MAWIGRRRWMRWGLAIALMGFLVACSQADSTLSRRWLIYRNERYRFEFPYPERWQAAPLVANQDGQLFFDPEQSEVKITGWASQSSVGMEWGTVAGVPNFVTEQGLPGYMQLEVGANVSTMTVTWVPNQVVYRWQGRSPSDQFDDYFKFFYYVASQFRVADEELTKAQMAPKAQ
ncbi:hypothetical protein ACQ4M4_00090 [Leptolyngbya sp. AN02str]|uniref:hypothetical protein n=1 Tax=Leptolyngbya sp. AN02str TaxID=3423363 RepID=UPI003D3216AD